MYVMHQKILKRKNGQVWSWFSGMFSFLFLGRFLAKIRLTLSTSSSFMVNLDKFGGFQLTQLKKISMVEYRIWGSTLPT